MKEIIYRRYWLNRFWRKYRISEGHRYKHTYIVAGTGAGKSEFLKTLIWQHIIYGKTAMVVLDPNGDFAEQVAKFKDNLIPFRKKRHCLHRPNPFQRYFPSSKPIGLTKYFNRNTR